MTIFRCEADIVRSSGRRRAAVWTIIGVFALITVLVGWRVLVVRSFDKGPLPPSLPTLAKLPVTLADGRRSSLGELVRPGVPTVISVWASWCGPCRREAPVLNDLRRRYGPEKLNFLYLNGREPLASRQDLSAFVRNLGMAADGYAILDDASLAKLTNDTRNLIPRTYVFDRAGAPVAMIVGYKPLALARVEGLLK